MQFYTMKRQTAQECIVRRFGESILSYWDFPPTLPTHNRIRRIVNTLTAIRISHGIILLGSLVLGELSEPFVLLEPPELPRLPEM